MDVIKNKLLESKSLIDELYEYFDKLKPLLEKTYPTELKLLNSTILSFPSMVSTINKRQEKLHHLLEEKKQSFTTVTTGIFELYASIQDYYHSVQMIVDVLAQPYMHSDNIDESDLSQTYKLVTADALDSLMLNYSTFVSKFSADDSKTIDILTIYLLHLIESHTTTHVTGGLANRTPIAKTPTTQTTTQHNKLIDIDKSYSYVSFIQSKFYEWPTTVSLYVTFMQRLIDSISLIKSQESKQLVRFILDQIEHDKDFYLSQLKIPQPKNKKIHLINPPLKRFGLLPITESMPLKDLIAMISSSVTSLTKLASENNVCIIVQYHVVQTPIEYNIKPLINIHLAKQQSQPAMFGVTDNLIKRFTTIKQLDDSEYLYNCDVIGKHDAADFYILETLDNINYRVLAPWLESKKYTVGRRYALPLLNYITKNIVDRSTNYQALCISQSLKNMFLPRPLGLDAMAEQAKDVDTQIIKNELFLKIKSIIDKLIDKQDISSLHDINDILHNAEIKETFVSIILVMYKVASKYTDLQEFDASKFAFSELFSSFLVELQAVSRQFMKMLHDIFNRSLPSNEIFQMSKREKNNLLYKLLDDILSQALQVTINDNSNIYSALNYKYLLLNF